MQPALKRRQPAQYGCLVVEQATYTATISSFSCCYSGRTSCLIIEKYKILLCTVCVIITYCVSFYFNWESCWREIRNSFGMKAGGCKAAEWGCRYLPLDKLISSGLYSARFSSVGPSQFYSLHPQFFGWTATTGVTGEIPC